MKHKLALILIAVSLGIAAGCLMAFSAVNDRLRYTDYKCKSTIDSLNAELRFSREAANGQI